MNVARSSDWDLRFSALEMEDVMSALRVSVLVSNPDPVNNPEGVDCVRRQRELLQAIEDEWYAGDPQ